MQSVSADMSNAVTSPPAKVTPQAEGASAPASVSHVLDLVQRANAIAKEKHGTPDWVPQKIRDAMKGWTDLNMAAAKRNALGDLLGYPREFQKEISLFLDKVLADADDIARWESLELSPDLQEFIQPQLEEKKNDLQWLEDRLAKLEGADEQQSEKIEEFPKQDKKVFTGSEQDSIIKEIEEFSRTLHKSVDLDVDHIMERAKTGKVHRGVYDDALTKNYRQLKKSIASRVTQVEEHIKKLQTPERYDVGWSTKNEVQKAGLLRKWRKDMQRNAEQAFIEIYIWKERFGNEH